MANVVQTQLPDGDAESEVLTALASGRPHVFIVCKMIEDEDALDIKLTVGGGVTQVSTIRAILEKTLAALPC